MLFAGAAVGVSHLVQSTRAGAAYGIGAVLLVLLACLLKYPAFSFGPRYAATTGTSLLEGYRRQGVSALLLYAGLTLGTMFTVQAAVTYVTAGIAIDLFSLPLPPLWVAIALTAISLGVVAIGRFRLLDLTVKMAVLLLTVATIAAAVLALPDARWELSTSGAFDRGSLLFLAALIGWMPSAIDISVWHSLWTLARQRDTDHVPTLRESLLDFNIGYIGTAVLAVCFVILGATIVGNGGPVPARADEFARMVISLYASKLGDWSRPLIGGAAFLVMLSTTLTVVDGFPRAIAALFSRLAYEEPVGGDRDARGGVIYLGALALLACGSIAVIARHLGHLAGLVDLATTLSFLTAPVLAALNHRAVFAAEVPASARPGPRLRKMSLLSIGFLTLFAIGYLCLRFLP